MFLEATTLQILILITLILVYYSSDLFYFILNSILFLVLITSYVWLKDGDLFLNFLLIIDLGLYFLFFIFFLHYSNLFSSVQLFRSSNLGFVYLTIVLIICSWSFKFCYLESESFSAVQLQLSFYNWYALSLFVFAADLQLLSELYFGFNFIEFILMNLYIYIVLLAIYYIISLPIVYTLVTWVRSFQYTSLLRLAGSSVFLKTQDLDKQRTSSEAVRVWGVSSNKLS